MRATSHLPQISLFGQRSRAWFMTSFALLAAFLGSASAAAAQNDGSRSSSEFPSPRASASSSSSTANAEKSIYNFFNPTPRNLMREMNTDRPDTTESPFTVDAGHFQLELSFLDFTYDHRSEGDQTTRAWQVAPLLFKVGLLNNVDLQLGLEPYDHVRTTDRASDESKTPQGFGDTIIRLKTNLWGNDSGRTAFAIMPFIKLPTARRDLGNGHIEGGIIFPLSVSLADTWDLGTMAEFDFNRSAANDRCVVDFVHALTIGHELSDAISMYAEYAGFANLNGDEKYRGYFNTGVTYGLTKDIQLDAGIRAGLTTAADDIGVFTGISIRF
jgi:hypothetical protein